MNLPEDIVRLSFAGAARQLQWRTLTRTFAGRLPQEHFACVDLWCRMYSLDLRCALRAYHVNPQPHVRQCNLRWFVLPPNPDSPPLPKGVCYAMEIKKVIKDTHVKYAVEVETRFSGADWMGHQDLFRNSYRCVSIGETGLLTWPNYQYMDVI